MFNASKFPSTPSIGNLRSRAALSGPRRHPGHRGLGPFDSWTLWALNHSLLCERADRCTSLLKLVRGGFQTHHGVGSKSSPPPVGDPLPTPARRLGDPRTPSTHPCQHERRPVVRIFPTGLVSDGLSCLPQGQSIVDSLSRWPPPRWPRRMCPSGPPSMHRLPPFVKARRSIGSLPHWVQEHPSRRPDHGSTGAGLRED